MESQPPAGSERAPDPTGDHSLSTDHSLPSDDHTLVQEDPPPAHGDPILVERQASGVHPTVDCSTVERHSLCNQYSGKPLSTSPSEQCSTSAERATDRSGEQPRNDEPRAKPTQHAEEHTSPQRRDSVSVAGYPSAAGSPPTGELHAESPSVDHTPPVEQTPAPSSEHASTDDRTPPCDPTPPPAPAGDGPHEAVHPVDRFGFRSKYVPTPSDIARELRRVDKWNKMSKAWPSWVSHRMTKVPSGCAIACAVTEWTQCNREGLHRHVFTDRYPDG